MKPSRVESESLVTPGLEGKYFGIPCPPRSHNSVRVFRAKLNNRLRFACSAIPAGYWTCSGVVSIRVQALFLFSSPVVVNEVSAKMQFELGCREFYERNNLPRCLFFCRGTGFDSSTTIMANSAATSRDFMLLPYTTESPSMRRPRSYTYYLHSMFSIKVSTGIYLFSAVFQVRQQRCQRT